MYPCVSKDRDNLIRGNVCVFGQSHIFSQSDNLQQWSHGTTHCKDRPQFLLHTATGNFKDLNNPKVVVVFLGGQLRSTNLCNTDSNLFSPPHCTDDPVLAGDQQNISQSDLLMEATKYRASVLNYDSESVLIEIFVFVVAKLIQ